MHTEQSVIVGFLGRLYARQFCVCVWNQGSLLYGDAVLTVSRGAGLGQLRLVSWKEEILPAVLCHTTCYQTDTFSLVFFS